MRTAIQSILIAILCAGASGCYIYGRDRDWHHGHRHGHRYDRDDARIYIAP